MAKKEYEEPESEEYDEEEEENELPDVDDDEELDEISDDEGEAVRRLAKVQTTGSKKAYRELRALTCRKFPDLGLCSTERYSDAFLAGKGSEQ